MARTPQLTLIGLTGPVAGRRYTIDGPDILLGRGQGCHIIIPSNYISRQHCALRFQSGRWVLEDLGARNPARLNAGPSNGPVRPGDVLSLADARFKIEFPDAWSNDERPTRIMDKDAALLREYGDVLKEIERKAKRPAPESVASSPPLEAAEPFQVGTGTWSAAPDRRPPPPDPTPDELAVLAEVHQRRSPPSPPEVMARLVAVPVQPPRMPLIRRELRAVHEDDAPPAEPRPEDVPSPDQLPFHLTNDRGRAAPTVPVRPQSERLEASEPGVIRPSPASRERARPLHDLSEMMYPEHYEDEDDLPTVNYIIEEKRGRHWPLVLGVIGLALVALGSRSCMSSTADRMLSIIPALSERVPPPRADQNPASSFTSPSTDQPASLPPRDR